MVCIFVFQNTSGGETAQTLTLLCDDFQRRVFRGLLRYERKRKYKRYLDLHLKLNVKRGALVAFLTRKLVEK